MSVPENLKQTYMKSSVCLLVFNHFSIYISNTSSFSCYIEIVIFTSIKHFDVITACFCKVHFLKSLAIGRISKKLV